MKIFSGRHVINTGGFFLKAPSPKFGDFWGGMFFLNKIVNFWFYEIKKILVRIWDKRGPLGQLSPPPIHHFRPQVKILKFQKCPKSHHF